MRLILAVVPALLAIVGQSQMAFSKQPLSKGKWTYKSGKPQSVTFDYGTELTIKDIDQLSRFTTITRIVMGYAGVDSEYVTIEGDLRELRRLINLEELHLCKDGINDDDLRFIASLPKIHTLEFNADNGYDGAPICTDQCAVHLRTAKTLRRLVIHDGQFTDKFVARITEGLQNLEQLSLNSAELTDESLRLLADRCKKLKSLSIASDHFTAEGLKRLDKLTNLQARSVSSPFLRERNDDTKRFLGTWEYVSATYEGKQLDDWKDASVTIAKDSWNLQWNEKTTSSTWEIDSTRSPKWLTRFTRGGKVNFLESSIYRFDGGQLVICESAHLDGRRPTRFVADEGDETHSLHFCEPRRRLSATPSKSVVAR